MLSSLGAASENPALLATVFTPSLSLSALRVPQVDLESFNASAALSISAVRFGLTLFQSRIADIVEDSTIDERDLSVGDFGVRLAAALSPRTGGVHVGAALTRSWSTVLATAGTATFLDLGVAYQVSSRVVLGVSLRRLGGPQRWMTASGERFNAAIVPAARFGTAVSLLGGGAIGLTLLHDVEYSKSRDRLDSGWGAELDMMRALRIRTGVKRQGTAPPTWATGIGLRIRGIQIDVVYDQPAVVGPRFGVGLYLVAGHLAPSR